MRRRYAILIKASAYTAQFFLCFDSYIFSSALEIRFRSISESVSIARTKPTEKPAQAVASMAGLFCSRVPIFSLNSEIDTILKLDIDKSN